jgi:hypothetical protein
VATLGGAKVKLASGRAWAVSRVGARTAKDQMMLVGSRVEAVDKCSRRSSAKGNSRLSGGSSKDLSRLRLQRSGSARAGSSWCRTEKTLSLDDAPTAVSCSGKLVQSQLAWLSHRSGRFPGRAGRPGGGPMTSASAGVEVAGSGK